MALVAAKCTQCGAAIEVDESKEAGICPHCGTAFITEKVINNYNIVNNVTNNIQTAIFKTGDDVEDYIRKFNAYVKIEEYFKLRELCDEMSKKFPDSAFTYILRASCDIYNARTTSLNPTFAEKFNRPITEGSYLKLFAKDKVAAVEELENNSDEYYLNPKSDLFLIKLDDYAIPYNHKTIKRNIELAKEFATESQKEEINAMIDDVNKQLEFIERYNAQVDRIHLLRNKVYKKRRQKRILTRALIIGVIGVAIGIAIVLKVTNVI